MYEDLTGQKFGKLKVIELKGLDKNKRIIWICKCDCGNIKEVAATNLRRNITKSCGCYRSEITKINNTKHGLNSTRFYSIYRGMLRRCYQTTHDNYHNYGKKGIRVSDNWKENFINFMNDMYESYLEHSFLNGEENTSLDRIDNNGNYEKENCKWATKKEQILNSSQCKAFIATRLSDMYQEKSISQTDFAEKYNLNQSTISAILKGKCKQTQGWIFQYV